MSLPRIALTVGDPAGIGPRSPQKRLVIHGCWRSASRLSTTRRLELDHRSRHCSRPTPGAPRTTATVRATADAMAGRVDAVTTAYNNLGATKQTGHVGQTGKSAAAPAAEPRSASSRLCRGAGRDGRAHERRRRSPRCRDGAARTAQRGARSAVRRNAAGRRPVRPRHQPRRYAAAVDRRHRACGDGRATSAATGSCRTPASAARCWRRSNDIAEIVEAVTHYVARPHHRARAGAGRGSNPLHARSREQECAARAAAAALAAAARSCSALCSGCSRCCSRIAVASAIDFAAAIAGCRRSRAHTSPRNVCRFDFAEEPVAPRRAKRVRSARPPPRRRSHRDCSRPARRGGPARPRPTARRPRGSRRCGPAARCSERLVVMAVQHQLRAVLAQHVAQCAGVRSGGGNNCAPSTGG